MRIPYGFTLVSGGMLEINRNEADIVCMIFDYYIVGASLGKVADMLYAKQVSSPTGKAKWTRAAVDHLLSNDKYIAIIGLEKFLDAQFEKSARCNIDHDK
nr:recombinase family protein [uncultured Oscillibacter sp.]